MYISFVTYVTIGNEHEWPGLVLLVLCWRKYGKACIWCGQQELRERVLRGKYRVPFYMSTDCEGILRRFLVLNPAKRCTLEVSVAQLTEQTCCEIPANVKLFCVSVSTASHEGQVDKCRVRGGWTEASYRTCWGLQWSSSHRWVSGLSACPLSSM